MDLYLKAAELGIQTDFFDGQGREHRTDLAALEIILGALPVRAGRRFVSGPVVLPDGKTSSIALNASVAMPVKWTITQGDTTIAEGTSKTADIDVCKTLGKALPHGIYRAKFTDAKHL